MARKNYKKNYKKKPMVKKSGGSSSVFDIAKKALNIAVGIKKLVNVEKKYFDTLVSTDYGSAFSCTNITNIAEGNDYNQRSGNSVLLQSVGLRLLTTIPSDNTPVTIRVMIIRDNDQRGTDPTMAELLESTTTPYTLVAPLYHAEHKRFTVLLDRLLMLNTGDGQQKVMQEYIDLTKKPTHVYYQSTDGTDASAHEGNLYFCTFNTKASAPYPNITWWTRVRYTDN